MFERVRKQARRNSQSQFERSLSTSQIATTDLELIVVFSSHRAIQSPTPMVCTYLLSGGGQLALQVLMLREQLGIILLQHCKAGGQLLHQLLRILILLHRA